MRRSEVLAIVADQFEQMGEQLDQHRKQLDLQLQRTAQMQAQLDHIGNLVKRLVEEDVTLSGQRPFQIQSAAKSPRTTDF
jgi:Mg2+ and Co2+ transporter CorA